MELNTKEKKKAGFVLTKDDIELLALIWGHRFLRLEHLHALTHRHVKSLARRLLKLKEHGFLISPHPTPNEKYLYGLRSAAVNILIEQGIVQPDLEGERIRTHELAGSYLKHEMMIVDIHVLLNLASEQQSLRVSNWREGKTFWRPFTDITGERRMFTPDALFTLEDRRRPEDVGEYHFALEADRSSATHPRFEPKLVTDWHFLKRGLHEETFNTKKAFRVLTITLTEERAAGLCALVQKQLPDASKVFLFTSLKQLSLENPVSIAFDDIWLSPRQPGRRALLPAGKTLQKDSA